MSQADALLRHQDFTDEEKEEMTLFLNKKGEYEETRRMILKQLTEVEYKITEMQSEYGAVCNRHNPILTLPNEVTCLIFTNAQLPMVVDEEEEDEEINEYLMEVVVSHVCHHWRTISLGYPKLWSTFFHTNYLTPSTLARFDAYMERSAALPLRLWFDFRPDANNPLNFQLFMSAAGHVHRWQHFTLYSEGSRDVLGQIPRLQGLSAPMLEYLVLFLEPDFDDDEDETGFSYSPVTNLDASIFGGAPKLTFSLLNDPTVFNAMPSLSNISTLWLEKRSNYEGPRFVTQAFIDILSLPSLEHVLFDGDFAEQANLVRRIEMPNLKRFYFSDFTAIWSLLPNIRAPHLETLMVYNCQFDATTPEPTLLDRSYRFPALRKLWIVDSELIPDVALTFVKLTSQVTEVLITHNVLRESFLTTIIDDLHKEKIWPHLKTLTCNIEGFTEIEPYLAFAKSRPKKSFKLKLHPYLLNHWEEIAADQFNTLQKVCMVEGMDEEEWIEQEYFWPKDMEFPPSTSDPEDEDNPCYVNSNY